MPHGLPGRAVMTPQWDWQVAAVALTFMLIAVVMGRLL